jgi:hypothetical protein
MIEPNDIINTMLDYYDADINKHIMNIEIMLHNPLAFHDHDKFNEAVENQSDLITESKDRKDALLLVQDFLNAGMVPFA